MTAPEVNADSTVETVLDRVLRPIGYQLETARAVADGRAATAIDAALMLFEQVRTEVLTQYNVEVDQYNELADYVGYLQLQLDQAQHELTALKEKSEIQSVEVLEAKAKVERLEARVRVEVSSLVTATKALKELQALDPKRLKENLHEVKRKLTEQVSLNDVLKQENLNVRRELANAQTKNTVMVNEMLALTTEAEELRTRLMMIDGDVEKDYYWSTFRDQKIGYYFYVFGFGLDISSGNPDVHLINTELRWHIEVRSTLGIGVIVSVTDWLTPFYPEPEINPVHSSWPEILHQKAIQKIRELCADSHPMLVARAEWAELQMLSDLGLPEKQLALLHAAKIHTLFDVVRRIPDALTIVKGIGEKSAREIHAHCMNVVKDWMTQYERNQRKNAA